MKFLRRYTATPNRLIDDTVMHYTSKIVYHALAFMQRPNGRVKLTVAKLVSLAGLCEDTVLQALQELEARGYIRKKRNWRWSQEHCRPVYCANTYKLSQNYDEGYTLISSTVMDIDTTPAGFCVLLFLYRCAGRTGRAFPSIRYIAGAWREKTGRGLEMSKSTVLRVLKRLAACQAFQKNTCDAKVGDQSCNSYYLTDMVPAKVTQSSNTAQDPSGNSFVCGGGSIFPEAYFSNKITGTYTDEERKNGVGEFGDLHSFGLDFSWMKPLYFDGTGVIVSFCDEPDLTA